MTCLLAAAALLSTCLSAASSEKAAQVSSWPPSEKIPTGCAAGPLMLEPLPAIMLRDADERKIFIGLIRSDPMTDLGPDVAPTRAQEAALTRAREALAAAGFTPGPDDSPTATLTCRRTECEPSWLLKMSATSLGKRTRIYAARVERPAEEGRRSIMVLLDASEALSFEKNGLRQLLADREKLKKLGFGCGWSLPPHEVQSKRTKKLK